MKLPFMPVHIVTEKTLQQMRLQAEAVARQRMAQKLKYLTTDNALLRCILGEIRQKTIQRRKEIKL